jgi:hypothetical protein
MNNDWLELQSFKCVRCDKVYHDKHPDRCVCRSPYEEGLMIGPFKITGAKVDEKLPVICLLCDSSKEIHYTALKRQKSCGCKPRWITIIDISEQFVRYRCIKCSQTHTEELPVLQYCCEGDSK